MVGETWLLFLGTRGEFPHVLDGTCHQFLRPVASAKSNESSDSLVAGGGVGGGDGVGSTLAIACV